MKKILLLTFTILMTSNIAWACGGIALKGKYCLSKHRMNWYSASAWCQAQGMNLVDVKEVCGSLTSTCTALQLSSEEKDMITAAGGKVDSVWTNTSKSDKNIYVMYLGSANLDGAWGRASSSYALCQ